MTPRSPRLAWTWAALLALATSTLAQTPVKEDPLVRMPGTQPQPEGNVTLEAPNRCLNCHAGYDQAVEPGFNWKGSMMAQASRDFLFWSCMTVAAQDSKFAIGSFNVTDLCLRCHFPIGWAEGRSDPTNATAMSAGDYDGLSCDVCHTAVDPFFDTTYDGTREGNDWLNYWDETNLSPTPSQAAADTTHQADSALSAGFLKFNGSQFFSNLRPPANYTENGSGQFFLSPDRQKRASFADAEARHSMLYSRYHKSKYFCGTCHDVSNPVLANLGADPALPLPTEVNPAFSYFHVERTFSEFILSDYGQQGGAPGIGPYDPSVFTTSLPNNNIGRCQDCHMPDSVGKGCNKNGVSLRPTESTEHPRSGMPVHDMTGGNAWVPWVLASSVAGSSNYDPVNDQLLNQGAAVLTVDMTAGQGLDPVALLDGAGRARIQLQKAAAIHDLNFDTATDTLTFKVQNQSGHKLISGFPEGRRMFVNIKAYEGSNLVWEVNPYDAAAGTLKDLGYNYQPGLVAPSALAAHEYMVDELVYEMKPSSALTEEEKSFHFVLGDDRYKDNRIPPKGFRISEAAARISQPRWHGADAPNLYTAAEYAGGFDSVSLAAPAGATNADYFEVRLYYQTTSREYIEFLRDEINGTGNLTLPPENYIIGSDPFFNQLRGWGDTIWQLWTHNMNVPGAAPVEMTVATAGSQPQVTVGVATLEAGKWVTTGNGQNRVTQFVVVTPPSGFAQGDEIVFRAQVLDQSNQPVTGAIVALIVTGPESPVLMSDPSDENGFAEARWQTRSSRKNQAGTALGSYTATTTGVAASGLVWDMVGTAIPFVIQ